jgi:hypothetical protein
MIALKWSALPVVGAVGFLVAAALAAYAQPVAIRALAAKGSTCFGGWQVPSPSGKDADYGAVRLNFSQKSGDANTIVVRIGTERGDKAYKDPAAGHRSFNDLGESVATASADGIELVTPGKFRLTFAPAGSGFTGILDGTQTGRNLTQIAKVTYATCK